MSLPWPPDWRKKEDYPNPETTAPRMWAWEYLRRDTNYQISCDKIGPDWFDQFRKKLKEAANITDEELKHLINPEKKYARNFYINAVHRLFQYCPSFPLKNNDHCYHYDSLCSDFRLICPDHYRLNESIIFFESDAVCFRRSDNNHYPILKQKISKEFQLSNRLRFEYRRNIILKSYQNYDDICKDIIFQRDPGGLKHINYLRVYDANEKNEEIEEIAKIVYGSIRKTSTAEKAFLSAKDYIGGKYKALAAPLYKI